MVVGSGHQPTIQTNKETNKQTAGNWKNMDGLGSETNQTNQQKQYTPKILIIRSELHVLGGEGVQAVRMTSIGNLLANIKISPLFLP